MLSSTLVAAASIVALAVPSQAVEAEVSDATLSWGVLERFRNYVTGPIAGGAIEAVSPATVASGIVSWSGGTGVIDDADHTGSVSYSGGVHYSGHGDEMDLTITNPRIVIESASSAVLYVDLDRTGYGAAFPDPAQESNVPLANIALNTPTVEDGLVTWTAAPATLHPDGLTVFIGFYPAGEPLDPITFSLPYEVATPDPEQTELALSASPASTADEDAEVAFTAAVTPAEAAGDVEFFTGSDSLGTQTVSDGTAALTTSDLSVGDHSITATFTPADAEAYTTAEAGPLNYTITATEEEPPVVTPSVTVSKTEGLDPEGETVTVTGTGFLPDPPATSGTRPPLAGQFTGAYVAFGSFLDEWQPSEGAPSSARQTHDVKWGVHEAQLATIGGVERGGIVIEADGTFETTLTVSEVEDALAEGNFGIYTYPGGGATYAPFETYTPITFAEGNDDDGDGDGEEPAEPDPSVTVSPSQDLDPSVENVLTVSGTGFVGDGAANGVYVLFGETSVWSGGGPLPSEGWIDLGWVRPDQLTDGEFTTTLTVPADSLDPEGEYHVATSAAHALSATNRTLDTFTPVTVAQGTDEPGETTPEIDIINPGDTVAQGETLRFTADGFVPGESVTATVYSDPIVIGTELADANGSVAFAWDVPDDFPAGEHTLELVGEISGTVEISFTITAAPTDDDGTDDDGTDDDGTDDDGTDDDGTDDGEPAPTCTVVDSGSLSWGVRESFRNYVVGPIANGAISTSGAVTQAENNGVFTWSGATGTFDENDDAGVVSFDGAVTFTGHDGVLDLTLSDPRIHVLSSTTGELVMDVTGTDYPAGNDISADDVVVATLTFTSSVNGDRLTITDAEALLTEDGTAAFAGFYAAGSELDPVSLDVTLGEDTECAEVPTPTTPRPTPVDEGDDGTDDGSDDTTGGAGTGTGTTAPQCVANAVSGATLSWGVRESFRGYIGGPIANGSIATSGGVSQADSGVFTWSGGSGAYNSADGIGRVSYGGTVRFTGHGGELDLSIANPRVQVTGAGSANLIADISSKGYNGPDVNASGVVIATLALPASSTSGNTVSWNGATATLTSAGAEAFAGFYSAGERLDPVSFSFTLGAEVDCTADTGTLSSTGAETSSAALLALSMVLFGATAVFVRNRRTATIGG